MERSTVAISEYECKLCGHTWFPRSPDYPRACPKCNSPRWDKGRARPPLKEQREQAAQRRLAEAQKLLGITSPTYAHRAAAKAGAAIEHAKEVFAESGLKPHAIKALIDDFAVELPLRMTVPCGALEDIARLQLETGETVLVTGALARLATPHSYVAETRGLSMSNGEYPDGIGANDRVMLTPVREYKGAIREGLIVLAVLHFKDGRDMATLKTWTGKTLQPKNPTFKPIEFGPEVDSAEVDSICRGVIEKVFG